MMNKTTETRIRRLEQGNGAELVKWRFVELRQSGDNPDLWAVGGELATLAEHAARQPAHTLLVCLTYAGG